MISKIAVWLATLALLGFSGCAYMGAYGLTMPSVPSGAELVRDEPIFCADRTLYLHVYDVNPATEAVVATVGPTDAKHSHGAPFIVIVVDDAGTRTYYVSVDGTKAEKLTQAEFVARYHGESGEAACSVAATVRAGV